MAAGPECWLSSGSGSGSPVPQANYTSPAPTQVQANPIAYSGGGAARSVTNTAAWSPFSDPFARQQSQGFWPRPCGPGGSILDTLFNIRDAGRAVIDGVNDFVRDPEAAFNRLADQGLANWHRNMQQLRDPNAWRQAYVDTRNFLRNNADVIVSTLPFIGELYDLTSAILGRDLITGRPLSSFEKTLILVGVAAGVLTFGLGDEAIDLGADLLRHMDDIDAGGVVKAGRGLSRVDEAAGAVRAENRLAREALIKADIGTGLNRADDVLETRLRHLPGFTGGNKPRLQGDDLRRALTGNSGRGALSRRLSNARGSANAIVPYDVYAAARQYNFPDRVTKAIVENLIPGRSIAIELKMLDDGSLVMKPAAKYLDDIAPYKHIDLKASKSDDFGFLVDARTGQLHISDPDIMIAIDDGRILSDAATVSLADDMNFVARRGQVPKPRIERGPLVLDPKDPFQHSHRATFFTKGAPIHTSDLRGKIAHVPPKDGVAVFTLDSYGHPIIYEVKGGTDYVDWVQKTAYNEDLSWYPWVNSNLDWNPWYNRPPGKRYYREITSRSPVRPQDAIADWEDFLGPGPYTNIHPRTGELDPNRLVSADRTRSVRYGSHEMNHHRPHYHLA